MVCANCKEALHNLCRGDTWCDCQHRGTIPVPVKTDEDDSEPVLRQLLDL